jgi:hypothetical protein
MWRGLTVFGGVVSPMGFHHGGLIGWVAVGLPAPGQWRSAFAFHRRELKSITRPSSRGRPSWIP